MPPESLRTLARRDVEGYIYDLSEVIRLQRYFRVNYATILIRRHSEGLLHPTQFQTYKGYSPRHLAHHLGLDGHLDERNPTHGVTLSTYPMSVLERVRALVEHGDLSPAAAAALLRVSQEAIRGQLLGAPKHADPSALRELQELPEFPARRATRGCQST